MVNSSSILGVALSILAVSACAQTGNGTGTAVTPTPAAIPAETQALPAEPVAAPAGWRPFSPDSPWNTPIAEGAAVDSKSDILLEGFADGSDLFVNIQEWTVTVRYLDAANTQKRNVSQLYPGRYGQGFGPGNRLPIPADAATPGAPQSEEYYISLVDPVQMKAWDVRQLGKDERGHWRAGFGAEVDLSGTGVAAPWMTASRPGESAGPRPSGVPLMAGLIRADEIKAGRIDHALAFAYAKPKAGVFVSPASTALEMTPERAERTFALPMGARMQLDPAYDIENTLLSPAGKVIARALQEYGAILVDEAGATTLFAEGGPGQAEAWEGVLSESELQLLFTPDFMMENFRVLELGPVMPGAPEAR